MVSLKIVFSYAGRHQYKRNSWTEINIGPYRKLNIFRNIFEKNCANLNQNLLKLSLGGPL